MFNKILVPLNQFRDNHATTVILVVHEEITLDMEHQAELKIKLIQYLHFECIQW